MNYKTETLKVYEEFPDYFNEKFEEYASKYIKGIMEEVCSVIPKNSKIFDLGSGSGNHAIFLKNKGFDVTCFDISEKMLQKCKEKGLKTIKGDFENINIPKNSLDVVWAYTSLLHVPKSNVPDIIDKISTILKKNGYLVLSLKEGIGEGFVDFKKGGKRWFSLYKHEEIFKLLNNKFEIIKNWRVQIIDNSGNYPKNSQNSLMDNSEKQIFINRIIHNENKTFLDYLCKKP